MEVRWAKKLDGKENERGDQELWRKKIFGRFKSGSPLASNGRFCWQPERKQKQK